MKEFLAQRRKGAKKAGRNTAVLCVVASLREKCSRIKHFSCKAMGDVFYAGGAALFSRF